MLLSTIRNLYISVSTSLFLGFAMRYNELKKIVLELLTNEWLRCKELIPLLKNRGIDLNISALRMAVSRYYKFALLHRRKYSGRGKELEYKISEKGKKRLQWLYDRGKYSTETNIDVEEVRK